MKKATWGGTLFLVALIAVTSCKKYEEGPGLSFRSKTARIAGTWEIEKYVDADGTERKDGSNTELIIGKEGALTQKETNVLGIRTSFEGTWAFANDNNDFKTNLKIVGIPTETQNRIIRLTNKEFWIKDSDGDKTYYKAKK